MDEPEGEIREEELKAQEIAKQLQSDLAFKQYSLEFQGAISDCQYIEEALKFYLHVTYKRIQEKLKPDMFFKYGDSDFAKDSMGKLISKFERLSNEDQLVRRLREVVEKRNFYAHEGFLYDFGKISVEEIDSMTKALAEFRGVTKGLLADLFKVITSLPIEGEKDTETLHQSKGHS